MVDAGPHERQPERDVDALVEPEVLDRDEALVVVLRHDEVELAIARERIAETEALARAASAPASTADIRSAVTRVLGEHSLASAPVEAKSAGARFAVVVADARFDAIVNALDALARNEGIRLVEGTVTARVDPGSVRAELTFAR